jgi:hypothetical protein
MDIGCYRGYGTARLSVNGQRTRTNARTREGKRKTVATRKRRRKAKGSQSGSHYYKDEKEKDRSRYEECLYPGNLNNTIITIPIEGNTIAWVRSGTIS